MKKETTFNKYKSLKMCLLAGFIFSAWLFLSAVLNFKQDLLIVFVSFFLLTVITMRVNDLKLNNKTLIIAVIGAIFFTIFVVFCTLYNVPDRNIYNFSTLVNAIAAVYGTQ